MSQKIKDFLAKIRLTKKIILPAVILVIIAAGTAVFYYSRPIIEKHYFYRAFDLAPKYAQAFSLVEDKISQSAAITINLPPGISKEEAQAKTKFNPAIKGEWVDSQDAAKIAYQPKGKLSLGKYYAVSLETANGIIGKDFLAEEDPQVVAIFPYENSEANENTDITIIFNRPMVPLSTIDEMNSGGFPVEITPATPGKFKWISTKTLQFIPETTLIPSSDYTVKIKPEFKSLDGLGVGAIAHKFNTRPLRYLDYPQNYLAYNEPIKIYFNQNVNLEKTAKEIWLKNTDRDQRIDFIAEYGQKTVYNKETKKNETREDRSVIYVYNKTDRYGRTKFWDFKTNYFIMVQKAYPEQGDIVLDESRQKSIFVEDVVSSIYAESDKTGFPSLDYFDPAGKLIVTFFEDVDINALKINTSKKFTAVYGEKCKQSDNNSYYSAAECEKKTDRKKIFFTFNPGELNLGETFGFEFQKIVSADGLLINRDPIKYAVKTAPKLKINSTRANGLIGFNICSNSQLAVPADKETARKRFQSNLDFEYQSWGSSYLITNGYYNPPCPVGDFYTRLDWRLMPESDYNFEISVADVFGSQEKINNSFRSGAMPDQYLSFFHFQKGFNVASIEKSTLSYAVENMTYVDMHICQISAEEMLKRLAGKPQYWQGPNDAGSCEKTVEKRIELTPKYWIKNYFQVKLSDYFPEASGNYVLTFSNPGYTERWGAYRQIFERTYLNITNLSVTKKEINIGEADRGRGKWNDLENFYWITDFKTLEPVAGADIKIYNHKKEVEKEIQTRADGTAETSATSSLIGAIVSSGNDSAVILNSENIFDSVGSAYTDRKIYLYTDRPIYRPGNTVHIKGLYRIGYDGNYEIFRDKKITLKAYNSSGQEIASRELDVSDFGTFNTDLPLDGKSPLGTYRLEAEYGYAYFDVEEYVPAPFKVETKSDRDEYISGDTATIDIDASYYFGAPLEGGTVEYSVNSQNYYFDKYQDEYFNFGSSWYYCWWGCSYGDKFLLRNKVELSDSGQAQIVQDLDLKKLFQNPSDRQSKIITVNMTVRNKSGQSIGAQKSFIVHAGDFYLGLKTDKYFLGKNEKVDLKVKTVDTQGKPKKLDNTTLKISRITWAESRRQEVDGGFYYRWEKKYEPISNEYIATDNDGNWSKVFSFASEGEYYVQATSTDARGNEISNSYTIYVYGEAYTDVEPSNDTSLDMVVSKSNLNVGDTGEVIIKSPFPKAKALISIERGKIFKYEIKDVTGGLFDYKFPVVEDYIPNVYLTATLISGDPEVKHGSAAFQINTKEKELDIQLKPNKENYLPGEDITINIEARDKSGKPAEAEISLAVVDLSVLALKGNPKKNPVIFYYGGLPLTVSTASNLKNILHNLDVPTGTKGGGGGGSEDLALKKRGEFKDTAYWEARIKTDKNGQARVKFTLPDNLTTWQAEAVGITQDTKLGAGYKEFIAQKELMITPLKPRFTVPGDEFSVGAKVFNQSDKNLKIEVSILDSTLEIIDQEPVKIKLDAGKTQTVYFRVKSPANIQDGEHKFTLSAVAGKLGDTVEQTIKITRNTTYENTATAGYSDKNSLNEYLFLPGNIIEDQGGLEIKTSATLAVFLSDSLNSLLSYPYGCSEQIASKLNSIAILKKGLNLENIGDKFNLKEVEFEGNKYSIDELVQIGLDKLYTAQNTNNGGFGYYQYGQQNFYLSLYLAEVFSNLNEAGYKIDKDRMKKLANFLNNELFSGRLYYATNDLYILTAYSVSRLEKISGVKADRRVTARIKSLENDQPYLKERINNLSLTRLALILSQNEKEYGKKYKETVYKTLENKLEIDSRGSFLPAGNMWQYYETSIKDTALLLKDLVADKRDSAVLDRILRWLLMSRAKDGSWSSTNNTVSVIDALTDYVFWKKENKSDFSLKILLNGQEKTSFAYGPQTILNQDRFSLGLKDLGLNRLNAITFQKTNNNKEANAFYYDLSLKYYLPANTIPPRDEGFTITRDFYKPDDKDFKNPVKEAVVGDVLVGRLKVTLPKDRNFVAIEDYIPAGLELVNFNLSTENRQALEDYYNGGNNNVCDYACEYWSWQDQRTIYPDFQENRDDRLFLFKERLPQGEYEYTYYVRVLVPGKFIALPSVASEMYFPENFGRTGGGYFVVNENKN